MAEADLDTYQLQLQQVEATLTADPENPELLTLRTDLLDVIKLTKELVAAQNASKPQTKAVTDEEKDENSRSKRKFNEDLKPLKHWQVGEQCQAIWPKDGQYYEAIIDEITTDGEVSVRFKSYGSTAVTTMGLLKVSSLGFTGTTSSANKKEMLVKQREYLKKKKAKKAERHKQLDKEREDEKTKWQSFSTKAFGKKGFVKKSIFKTPENPKGRVGVGTCGVSGQQMTKFSSATKYRRGT